MWVGEGGSGCSFFVILPFLPVFLQDIWHIISIQSTGSGITKVELPATG